MPDLLLELLSEEIPARMQKHAADDLRRLLEDGLRDRELTFASVHTESTPRRLVAIVEGLPEKQADRTIERRGPKVGAPAKALQGFLKSTGLDESQLETRQKGKDSYYFAVVQEKGRPTAESVRDVIETMLPDFPWPKSMRWGEHQVRWVRPLTNILCLLDGAVVPVTFGPLTANNLTAGHRFMAPEKVAVTSAAHYREVLKERKVVLSRERRRQTIHTDANASAEKAGGQLVDDAALLDEIAGLVEWPVVLSGTIEDEFMSLPPEVLMTSMRSHQKYCAVKDKEGDALLPHFIFAANIEAHDGGEAIIRGNERVLRARLADAAFFWEQDQLTPLTERQQALGSMVFHAKLGTMEDKTRRIGSLATFLSVWVPHAGLKEVEQAARLCKADLVTEMVGEFPELQGVVGHYYALTQGEGHAVADAIRDHYKPQGPNDACPQAPVSVAIAMADKMDSLAGLFAVGEAPTGSKDPYALRRAAIGVIRLIRENGLRVPLKLLIDKALRLYPALLFKEKDEGGRKKDARLRHTSEALLAFFVDRLKVLLKDQGYRHDHIAAIFAGGGEDDLVRLMLRVDSLKRFLATDDGAALLAAYKRASNILKAEEKKDGTRYSGRVDSSLLMEPEEAALFEQTRRLRKEQKSLLKDEQFIPAMDGLSSLKAPLDAFFDKVTVNSDNPELRKNRLLLLAMLRELMDQLADFSAIEG